MNFFLLDAGGVFLFEFVILLFLAVATVAEAIVMIVMKFNNAAKCFLDALLVNLASLAAGFFLLKFMGTNKGREEVSTSATGIFVMFLVTIAIEGLLLMLLNKNKTPRKVWLTNLAMNVVSYLLLLIFIS